MLDLNQGIYEHFLRRRGDNSTIRYWLLARRGLWEDVPEDGDKNKFQPSAWAECAGRTKTTNLHHHQEGSSGVEEIACSDSGKGITWSDNESQNTYNVVIAFIVHLTPMESSFLLTCLDCVWIYGSQLRFPLSFLNRFCTKSIKQASVPWSTLTISQMPSQRRISLQRLTGKKKRF